MYKDKVVCKQLNIQFLNKTKNDLRPKFM